MFFRILFALIVFFLIYSCAYPISIKTHELQSLREGKVVLKSIKENSVKGTNSKILINAPQEKVWKLLEEKENLSKFIKQIQETEVLKESSNAQTIKTSIKICKLLPSFNYVVAFDNSQKYKRMSFKKTDGCCKKFFGDVELIPDGKNTILDCKVYLDPGLYLPSLVTKKFNSEVECVMRTIKKEAEK